MPIRSVRKLLSIVTTCETLATDSLAKPVALRGNNTLPGACASLTLDVMATAMMVAMRLLLKSLDWTTRIGLR